jgi:hypothetical protein
MVGVLVGALFISQRVFLWQREQEFYKDLFLEEN